jgi:hypothetical protein
MSNLDNPSAVAIPSVQHDEERDRQNLIAMVEEVHEMRELSRIELEN